MPCSAARYLTARPRNDLFSRAAVRPVGMAAQAFSATSRSAAKWFFPPSA